MGIDITGNIITTRITGITESIAISDLTDMTGMLATTVLRIATPGIAVITAESGERRVTERVTATDTSRIGTTAEITEAMTAGSAAGAGSQ